MIEVHCNASPFVFKPILNLLDKIDFQPATIREGVILNTLQPFTEKYKTFKEESHLTDSQTKEEQIRYLGNVEASNKMIHLAYALKDKLKGEQIVFKTSPYFKAHELFNLFLKYLKLQANCEILFSLETDEGPEFSVCETTDKLEFLCHASETQRVENGKFIFDSALTCINAGDYFSAINLLLSIRSIDLDDPYFETDILCHLAICHGAIGELKESIFYWTYVNKSEHAVHRNRASYALGLMYLRHLPKQFQDLNLGEKYLQDNYKELIENGNADPIRDQIDKVFNRNGYALAEFKRGNVDEAENLVATGINTLEQIGSSLSSFHQSVLYYNLAQCHKAKKETDKVEKILEKLIEIDPRFCLYHEYLTEFYIENEQTDKAFWALERGMKVDENHIPFHFLKGKIHAQLGDYESALTHYEYAHKLDPNDTGTLAYLTSIYNAYENFDAVLDVLKTFHFKFANDENGELIINNLIIALLNTSEDGDEAMQLLEECTKLKPESAFFQEITNTLNAEYVD